MGCNRIKVQALNQDDPPDEDQLVEKVQLDMVLPFSQCSEELMQEITLLEPCGPGNSRPLFGARHVQISRVRLLGKDRRVLSFSGDDGSGVIMPCVYFGDTQRMIEDIDEKTGVRIDSGDVTGLRLTLAYTLNINEYRGSRTLQALVRDVLVET